MAGTCWDLLVEHSAPSRGNFELMPCFPRSYQDAFLQSPRMKSPQPLWVTHSSVWPHWWIFLFPWYLIRSVPDSIYCFSQWKSHFGPQRWLHLVYAYLVGSWRKQQNLCQPPPLKTIRPDLLSLFSSCAPAPSSSWRPSSGFASLCPCLLCTGKPKTAT